MSVVTNGLPVPKPFYVNHIDTAEIARDIAVAKLLKSAVSNAENNFGMNTDALYVSEIHADPGPIIKRYRARAHGRGASILKRTSHISIVVKDKE